MYSDYEEEYTYEYDYEPEFTYDDFLDYYTDDVLYILEDIKSRFSLSPFFLSNVNLPILTNFIINQIIKKPNTLQIINTSVQNMEGAVTQNHNNHIFLFNNYYKQELEISYSIVYKFIKRFKIILPYKCWLYFCYTYSDLYEIKNYI